MRTGGVTSLFFLCEDHAHGNEHRADDAHDGDRLAEQQPAYEHRHEGGGVEVVVGDHHAQRLESDVPNGEAHGVAHDTEEQPAHQYLGLGEQGSQSGETVGEEAQGNSGEEGP